MAAASETIGTGTEGSAAAGSEATATAEPAAFSSLAALVEGFGASLPKRLDAGTRRTANAAAAIIFILNLIVAS
jgi:hypothetical protein